MQIEKTALNFEREPMTKPFGFKGGYLSEIWQIIALLENHSNIESVGLGVQSTLWSDADIFARYSESAGNSIMLLMTDFALQQSKTLQWQNPIELVEALIPTVWEYGKRITEYDDLRLTFALNALVPVDLAAWKLYAAANDLNTFDTMLPKEHRSVLAARQEQLAQIPLMSYNVSLDQIEKAVKAGHFILKIKIGSNPDGDGDREKMLAWDCDRLSQIHRHIGSYETPYTQNGKIAYYLDANGRYDSKNRLMRLIEHAQKIGALDQIVLLEEPFDEHNHVDVSDIPVRLAADESAHSDKEALIKIQAGYGAVALKPIAKTLSMSLKVAQLCRQHNIPCFCADLTVNPVMVEWNKNVAARLETLPGLKIGVLESNGHQHYRNWSQMLSYHPCSNADWAQPQKGMYCLTDDFYSQSGGIFESLPHYEQLTHLK